MQDHKFKLQTIVQILHQILYIWHGVDRVPDEAVDCSGQNIIRKDRSNGKGGGGIAVYVNDRIPIKLRDDLNDSACEYYG